MVEFIVIFAAIYVVWWIFDKIGDAITNLFF